MLSATQKQDSARRLKNARAREARRNKRVKESNERFAKASPAQQRCILARDIIDALMLKKFGLEPGTWIAWDKVPSVHQPLFPQVQSVQCDVCALGGAFMCALRYKPEAHIDTYGNGCSVHTIFDTLEEYFEREQLEMIESAFERGQGYHKDEDSMEFGKRFEDHDERLNAIMANVIANKGTFIP